MPEVSAFCPACGREVKPAGPVQASVAGVAPLSRYALLGAIAYLILPAMVFVFLPALKKSSYARFHSWQCLFLAAAIVVLGFVTRGVFAVVSLFPFVGFLLAWLIVGVVSLAAVFLWLAIVVKAALGDPYDLPVIGAWAAELADRP